MKLNLGQLTTHLQKTLAPIYVISGDEPFQVGEACAAIREKARSQGFSERQVFHVDAKFDWQEFAASASAMSLFAERKLIELRIPTAKPGDEGTKSLAAYAAKPPDDTILMLICGKFERAQLKSKWLTALEQAGALLEIWPIELSQLPAWIQQRMQSRGMQPTPAAVKLLAEQVEGNLLAADQEMEKLLLLHGEGPIDVEDVVAAVSDSARFDVFSLFETALLGDTARATRILSGLRAEGVDALSLLGALAFQVRAQAGMAQALVQTRDVEQVMNEYRIWGKRQTSVRLGLQRYRAPVWQAMLRKLSDIDRMAKGLAAGRVWDELLQLVLWLAGSPLRPPAGFKPMVALRD